MPAILVGRRRSNPGANDERTVAEANAVNVNKLNIGASAIMTDAGTVTSGTGADVPVVAGDKITLQTDRSWQNDGPGEERRSGTWRAGEIVNTFEADHRFGFLEMPILPFGTRTVEQVNGLDVTSVPVYSSVQMTDSGTITSGTGDDVGVFNGDVIVLQSDDSWTNFGPRTDVPDGFFHIRVSNRTVEEVDIYLEAWTKLLDYESNQFDPGTGLRRFTTTNNRVSVTGKNGFTEAGIAEVISTWNENYPDNTVALVDTDNLRFFQVDGIMPDELYDEWRQNTQQVALADLWERRRWKITQPGLDALEVNDWTINGVWADVEPFLRDGLLD